MPIRFWRELSVFLGTILRIPIIFVLVLNMNHLRMPNAVGQTFFYWRKTFEIVINMWLLYNIWHLFFVYMSEPCIMCAYKKDMLSIIFDRRNNLTFLLLLDIIRTYLASEFFLSYCKHIALYHHKNVDKTFNKHR